ncbi:hypothetical protein IEO21_08874 [Rhodonia placenta]|uniref:DUF6534 domain-containing protein n=1 Tax=Rhodonia placenta TaxID=104341 RepID=A0A8H7NVE9_9APHY|nr:hypothetical protein IEO21_08874 [Postia placenta]
MTGPNLHLDITLGCLFVGTLFSLMYFCVLPHGVEVESVASFCGIILCNITATFVGICSLLEISALVYVPSVLASDAFITATLCWILHGQRTGFRTTEMLLTKLIVYSTNRGLHEPSGARRQTVCLPGERY